MSRWAPLPFTLRQIQYALAVAETKHFRRAAELCHVSQPSLSAQLHELELALEVVLFERDKRRVIVTPAGQALLPRLQKLLTSSEDLVAAAKQFSDPLCGVLRLGVIPTVSPYLLPLVAPELRKRFAKLTTHWVEEKTDVLVRKLDAGDIDAAIVALEADLGEVEHEPILYDRFVLATPKGHALSKVTRPATRKEIRNVPLLLLDDGHCLRDQALSFCEPAKTRELAYRATSLPTLAQMVAGGAGVTLLPELAVSAEAKRNGLVVRAFEEPGPSRTLALVWRPSSPLQQTLREIAAALKGAHRKRARDT
jgi:LysR family hydrogen peroxide-inducible transcriptional activator